MLIAAHVQSIRERFERMIELCVSALARVVLLIACIKLCPSGLRFVRDRDRLCIARSEHVFEGVGFAMAPRKLMIERGIEMIEPMMTTEARDVVIYEPGTTAFSPIVVVA